LDSITKGQLLEEDSYNPITTNEGDLQNNGSNVSDRKQSKNEFQLKALFQKLIFFILATKSDVKKELNRYSVAYDAEVTDDPKMATHLISEEKNWNSQIEKAFKQNSNLKLVHSSWLWKCVNQGSIVPIDNFIIEKK
jgi:hypothetical protein